MMRNIINIRKLGTTLCVFCIGLGIGFFGNVFSEKVLVRSLQQTLAVCAKNIQNQAYIGCLRQRLWPIVSPHTLPFVMQYLETHAKSPEFFSRNGSISTCHTIGHIIGEIVARSETSIPTLIRSCGTGRTCGDGCVHGVILEKIKANPSAISMIEQICGISDVSASTMETINCYHAFGHVYAQVGAPSMVDALQLCDKIYTEEYKAQCLDGVFMEFFVPTLDSHMSYGTLDQEFMGCSALPDVSLRFRCYTHIGESIYLAGTVDFQHAILSCQREDVRATTGCLYGFIQGVIAEDGVGRLASVACKSLSQINQGICYDQAKIILENRHDN